MELYDYEKEHISLLRDMTPECMVLLKSDNTFPIVQPEKVALYGSGARNTIKGGTGSGDVNVRHFVTIEEGLEKAGFEVTTKEWLDAYEIKYKEARQAFVRSIKDEAKIKGIPAIMIGMGAVMPEPEYELPLNGEGELAIYVLSRISGEGSDRKAVKGDFALTETEISDILTLQRRYKKFLLVLNVGGVVDLSPVQNVANILLLSQLGMTVGDSFADVLLGKSYPSGKLTSTWAGIEDYCSIGEFGDQDDTRYKEGIYVGYRYFDTIQKTPLYPFGHGLGYTTFLINDESVSVERTTVRVTCNVKNTGEFAGKETVQLYASVPAGRLDQPYQMLVAFAKTAELKPGEQQKVILEFSMEDLASFDEGDAAEILEAGNYILRIGNSSKNTHVCAIIVLDQKIIVNMRHHVGGTPDFQDWKPEVQVGNSEKEAEEIEVAPRVHVMVSDYKSKEQKLSPGVSESVKKLVSVMSESDLAYLCVGGFQEEGSKSFVGNAAMSVAGAAGETTHRFYDKGIPSIIMADGPAGLRISRQFGVDENGVYSIGDTVPAAFAEFADEVVLKSFGLANENKSERHGEIYDQYCTALPIGTAIAQSWNIEIGEKCGDIVGSEMERFGINLWLAPALNIQRSPLCGRNFEYYSEDPLISGKMAAAVTRGVQKHQGCGVTVKHYACNNQETNRFHSNSIVSERALRDIYLKGFRIVVEEAAPYALMTSYNLINGEHTSQMRDLNVTVLREEWGFKGMVMSDWVTQGLASGVQFKYPYACASGSIKAGNDIMMPGTQMDYQDLMSALNDENHKYHITRKNLEECAARVISVANILAGQKTVKERNE